jgi:tRNA threonylcarbamoyladenosine biosynthesis protein TsaE
MSRGRIVLNSAEETASFGAMFASQLKAGQTLALKGDLGAGKTTFVQGLLKGFSISDVAQSPTFTYLQIYQGTVPIYHFDLYRLKNEQDFVLLGFEEFLYGDGVAVIEWPERISSLLPKDTHLIELSYIPQGRTALVHSWGAREI